ncbi:MAG: putative DNA-binding domain-containing protein [Gammaproteobacteria bacterium]|nr:putative DNA-binding domain-containing protein [Gammaproteobacteria bacterium]
MGELHDLQRAFTEHLRDPDTVPMPGALEPRRVSIYSDLIFNNVSALLSDFFPVIKTILSDKAWHRLVREFFIGHQAETPYFPKVAEEFVHYLATRQESVGDPPFLLELAHYEWIELHLYTHEGEIPETPVADDELMRAPLALSEVAQPLAYRYPVHRIAPEFIPEEPAETHLLVFRDADEAVRFFELQPLSFQFLATLAEHPGTVAAEWLRDVADRLDIDDADGFVSQGEAMVRHFNAERILRRNGEATRA